MHIHILIRYNTRVNKMYDRLNPFLPEMDTATYIFMQS